MRDSKDRGRLVVLSFFIVYLCVGLWVFKDFGISWDEGRNRQNGAISTWYVKDNTYRLLGWQSQDRGENALLKYRDKDYGVFVELPLYVLEKLLNLNDARDVYFMRHLCTFILFWLSVIVFFFLVQYRYQDWRVGLYGCLFLILSPRIFAHSFYNSKDLGFLAVFIMSMYTLMRFLGDKSYGTAFFHAMSSAALISTRILGVLIPCVTILCITLGLLRTGEPGEKKKKTLLYLLMYVVLMFAFTIIFWPYLWDNPIHNFIEAFKNMSKFRWSGNVLYFGRFIRASDLPWHYIPMWFVLTTPLIFVMWFCFGIVSIVRCVARYGVAIVDNKEDLQDVVFLSLFLLPILSVMALGSVLYDGWRHLFFIYPPFVMVSVRGFRSIIDATKGKRGKTRFKDIYVVSMFALISGFFFAAYHITQYHPYQNVYFNVLGGTSISKKFELDYWGLSYRQGFEYILENDTDKLINVSSANFPGYLNMTILKREDRERLRHVDLREAKYYLSNYRGFREYNKSRRKEYPYRYELWSLKVGGEKIMGVYKLR